MGNKSPFAEHSSTALGLVRARMYRGAYTRVARKLGVHRSVVQRVGAGNKRSARIEAALMDELRRIERKLVRLEKKIKSAA